MNEPETPPAVGALHLYEKLIATHSKADRKGATMPYTSVSGHMYSFLTKGGRLALRLPVEDREAFMKKYKTQLCEQHGVVMKEYVEVPETLLARTAELKKFFETAYTYAATLKPKPMPKKKGKG